MPRGRKRCAPPSEWTPRGPTRRAAAYEHAAVGDAPQFGFAHRKPDQRAAAQMDASHLGLARPGPARFAAARTKAPQPGLTRRCRTHAPRPGAARRDSDCRAAARLGVPQFGWTRRSADKKPAAFPSPPLPAERLFCAGLRARAPLPFHAPNDPRCRVTVPAALQARRPPFRTARDINARSTNRRTGGRIAFVVCVYCLSPPTCSEKGLRRSPRNPSAQKAVKSDSLDNKHRNAVPNVKILLKTHSKQSKKPSKSNPLDVERRNVLPDDRSLFRMAQQTIRHRPAESEPVRQDETHKKPKTVDRTAFRLSALNGKMRGCSKRIFYADAHRLCILRSTLSHRRRFTMQSVPTIRRPRATPGPAPCRPPRRRSHSLFPRSRPPTH